MKHMRRPFILGLLLLVSSALFAASWVNVPIDKGWTFKQARGHQWYNATVPGVVHTDLLNLGLMDDPFMGLNERKAQWIDKEDWIYKTDLIIPSSARNKQNLDLVFDGLDTYADVYLNDSLILKTDNMFRQWRVSVGSLVKKDSNELRVYFHSPLKIDIPKFNALPYQLECANDQSENGGVFDKKVSVFARKAGYHYGWDWGPRLLTSGIWRPVRLEAWDEARIEDVYYQQKKVTQQEAILDVVMTIDATTACKADLSILSEGLVKENLSVDLVKGTNTIKKEIRIKKPKLWWSIGLGDPHLSTFETRLSVGGELVEAKKSRIGLRSVEVIRSKDKEGTSFYFKLNGVPVFMKGANYIPQDNFLPRVTDAQYEKTIQDAVDANMNMLRVWGGGIYENEIFYDLCDEKGILVWQDFMFACSLYPAEGELLENIRQEAIYNVKRLRNHPSVAIWCGNNENHYAWHNWGWKKQYGKLGNGYADTIFNQLYNQYFVVLPEVVSEYAPETFYWPSSPFGGDINKASMGEDGDAHYWGVWHAMDSIGSYNRVRARFFSEYGFQAFPEFESVKVYAPDSSDWNIFSEVMMAHQRGGDKANGRIKSYLLDEYREPKDFESFLHMGLILQGDAIKTAIEAHRRDMPYCMGTLFWQHNDCWPVASWSSRDYYGRWKAQHYFTKKAFNDILVSPIAKDNQLDVYVISDKLARQSMTLEVRVIDFSGNQVYSDKRKVTVPANTSTKLFTAELSKVLKGRKSNEVAVVAKLTDKNNKPVSDNVYYLTKQKYVDFPQVKITHKVEKADGGYRVQLVSDKLARGVFMSIEGLNNFFGDNYFDLLPNEPKEIFVTSDLPQEDFVRQLKIRSMVDSY
ncbi:MAG: beta-mannosidase [Bacteroidales bacterium]